MNYIFKLIVLGILSIALIENGYARNPNETSTGKILDTLQVKGSIQVPNWSITNKTHKNPDESNILERNKDTEIESWDIWENGDTNLNGYLWTVNLKSGPFPTKEKAKQAGIELINVTSNTINLSQKYISSSQAINNTDNKSSNPEEFSWKVNFRIGSYKSKTIAQNIVQKLKANKSSYKDIIISREPIDLKTLKSEGTTRSIITGELVLTRNKSSAKNNIKYSILISTKGNTLNVRKEPSTSSPIISSLRNGIKVPYVKEYINEKKNELWFYVKYSKDNVGWVSSKFSQKITDSSIITTQANSINPLRPQITQNNKNSANNNLRNNKKPTTRIQESLAKVKVENPNTKKEKLTKSIELESLIEINISRIADLQKINTALRLKNEKISQEIGDLRRTNTILGMEKEFKTKNLLELKASTVLIQAELDKIKREYYKLKPETLRDPRELQAINEVNSKDLITSQKKYAALQLENEDKTKQIAYLKKSIATLRNNNNLDNKTSNLSKLKADKITTTENYKPLTVPMRLNTSLNSNDVINTQNTIKPYLRNWIKAWESRNIALYLSFYSKNFKDPKKSYSQWEIQRRRSLNNSTNISIKITDLKTQILKDKSIRVSFVQKFISNVISDIGIKEMFWEKEDNNWKIIKETWIPQ